MAVDNSSAHLAAAAIRSRERCSPQARCHVVSRSERIRLGVFLLVSLGVLLGSIGALSGSRLLERRDDYLIRFVSASVTGLEVGADVRYQGVRVGRVEEIRIDGVDLQTVIVDLSLKPGTPIRVDTEAFLQFQGITGLKMIELRAGDPHSPVLAPGGEIRASATFVDELGQRAEGIADRLDRVLEGLAGVVNIDNRERLAALLTAIQALSDSLAVVFGQVGELTSHSDLAVRQTSLLLAHADSLLTDRALPETIHNLAAITGDLRAAHLDSLAAAAEKTFVDAGQAFTRMDLLLLQSREDILRATESLRESADHMNEFSRRIAEDPSRILRRGGEEEIDAPWEADQ
jgi:ABC-type transporter Mla subunit MlaD